ncbi:unnamed protein product [marine sediment metagenome]|uniref:Uncharacterized protein n=1 Tax=marine sediment metagenome TaxID=412755 RepID=X1SYL6_9ZZZZ
MTLDKAIELSKLLDFKRIRLFSRDEMDAIHLLIEAGKFIKLQRKSIFKAEIRWLPGETPETAPRRSLHHIREVLSSPWGREPKE